jgi:dienelactone hydrolase
MPDFFYGSPADVSWYPPKTKEHGEKLGAFFAGPAEPSKTLSKIPEVIAEVETSCDIKSWGILGYCWGGKIVSLATAGDTKFKAGAELHPAMVAPDDAKKINIPICMLASKDENADDIKAFEANLSAKGSYVEIFGDQVHGWMAARADLEDERCKEEYERGYKLLLEFFHDTM